MPKVHEWNNKIHDTREKPRARVVDERWQLGKLQKLVEAHKNSRLDIRTASDHMNVVGCSRNAEDSHLVSERSY